MSTPHPDINEKEAMTDLLASDGWHLFVTAVNAQWGPAAQIDQIDRALSALPRGDREAVEDTVQQIRAASKAALGVLDWPRTRLGQLASAEKQAAGMLSGFRRRA